MPRDKAKKEEKPIPLESKHLLSQSSKFLELASRPPSPVTSGPRCPSHAASFHSPRAFIQELGRAARRTAPRRTI